MRKNSLLLIIVIMILTSSSLLAQVLYDLTDLGEGTAYSINNSGQIVGTAKYPSWELPDGSFASAPHAVLFDSTGDGNNIYIGEGIAYSINNSGQIVGRFGILVDNVYAVLFNPTDDGNNFDVIILSNNGNSCAYSINDSGQIVGRSGGAVLFDLTGNGSNIDLGTGCAYFINNSGQIVGASSEPPPFPYPFPIPSINSATLFGPIGTGNNLNLDTYKTSLLESSATSINNYGHIVGYIWISSSIVPLQNNVQATSLLLSNLPPVDGNTIIVDPNGIIWPPGFFSAKRATFFNSMGDGNNIDLGTLPDGGNSCAYSINDKLQIVGYAYTASDEKHAAMFDSTGGGNNIDLNKLIDPALGWTLTEARSINDNGWIVGQMTDTDGDEHAFLLKPTPLKITISNIEEAIAEKLYAFEGIDIALDREWAAVEMLNEMLASKNFGDLERRDIHKAKLSIYRSIRRQMQSKAELLRSIKDLEKSLELLNAD